jgi:hypothetical protein
LTQARLGKETYQKIFEYTDFSFAELTNVKFHDIDFGKVNLSGSFLKNVTFEECYFPFPNFRNTYISNLKFDTCAAKNMYLEESCINVLTIENSMIEKLDIDLSFVNNFEFKASVISELSFYQSIVNTIKPDGYVDYFQLILNEGDLKSYFKESSNRIAFEKLENLHFDDKIGFTVDTIPGSFMVFSSKLSGDAFSGMKRVFENTEAFKKVTILTSKPSHFSKTSLDKEYIKKQGDSLVHTFINTKTSREMLLNNIRHQYAIENLDSLTIKDSLKQLFETMTSKKDENVALSRFINISEGSKWKYEDFKKKQWFNRNN